MAKTPSTMLALGTTAPDFNLPSTEGGYVKLADFEGKKALLVMFICNHCPFVVHLAPALAKLGREYAPKGLAIVAISSNDAEKYRDDGPEKMKEEKALRGYTFPYLYDESQAVAISYQAACTPDFFLFNAKKQLVYRGQFDDSRPGNALPITGKDLLGAVDAVLAGKSVQPAQRPSIGCNIKWKPGQAPAYFAPIV